MVKQSFSWRDYISIRTASAYDTREGDDASFRTEKSFTVNEIRHIEKMLDDIAAADPDGLELIRAAFTQNHHKKIEIQPCAPPFRGSKAFTEHGNIRFDFDQNRYFGVTTPQGLRALSSTGILVHELFHLADPGAYETVTVALHCQKHVDAPRLSPHQQQAVMDAFLHIRENITREITGGHAYTEAQGIARDKQMSAMRSEIYARIARDAHVPEGSFRLLGYPKIEDPRRRKLNGPPPQCEQDATHYTDSFMAKHFPGEPWRGNYDNFEELEISPQIEQVRSMMHQYFDEVEILMAKPGCGKLKTGYSPREVSIEGLGKLKQPTISSDPSVFCKDPFAKPR